MHIVGVEFNGTLKKLVPGFVGESVKVLPTNALLIDNHQM